jgi:ABC-2 type transport system ATP-binding protein
MIEVKGLSVKSGRNIILHNVSFSVEKGVIVGLIGPNGSGKTTIINVLAGLIAPENGTVTIDGKPVIPQRYNSLIGYCPQENSFFEKLTVGENIGYFADLYKVSSEEKTILIKKLTFFLGLEEKVDAKAETLSGGQKRRLNIACALVNSPKILLMDEPSLALDPYSRRNLWKLILEINKSGTTIILSSNMLEEIKYLCSSVIAIKGGVIAFNDSGSLGNEKVEKLFTQRV